MAKQRILPLKIVTGGVAPPNLHGIELLDLAIMQKTPERLAPASHFRASGAPVGRNGIGLSPPLRMELVHLGGTRRLRSITLSNSEPSRPQKAVIQNQNSKITTAPIDPYTLS